MNLNLVKYNFKTIMKFLNKYYKCEVICGKIVDCFQNQCSSMIQDFTTSTLSHEQYLFKIS